MELIEFNGLIMKVVLLSLMLIISGCTTSLESSSNPSEGLIYAVKPYYPALAFKNRVTGVVWVKYDVNNQGNTYNIKVIKQWPAGYFKQSATQAISQMKYVEGHPREGLIFNLSYKISTDEDIMREIELKKAKTN